MPNDRLLLAQLDVSIRSLERSMRKAGVVVDRSSQRMEKRWEKMSSRIEQRTNRMGTAIAAAIAAIGLQAVGRDVVRFGDDWVDYTNKLAAASEVSGFAAASLKELQAGARDARSVLAGYIDLYARILRASDGVAESTEQVAKVTNLAAKAFAAGGASATEQAAGVLQLGQALGSGFLQGDELRSLRENAPLIAKAIADAFGTSIGGLKKLGEEGKLTSDKVFKALLDAAPDIEAAFGATIPRATEEARRAMDDLSVSVGEYLVKSGNLEAASNAVAAAIQFVSNNVEAFADAIIISSAAVAGLLGAQGLLAVRSGFIAVAAGANTASGAMAVLRAASAFLLGPAGFVLAVGAASAAVAAFVLNSDKMNLSLDKTGRAIEDANELLRETQIYVDKKPIGDLGAQALEALGPLRELVAELGEFNEALTESLTANFITQMTALDTQLENLNAQAGTLRRQIRNFEFDPQAAELVSELRQELGKIDATINGLENRKAAIALNIFGEGRGKAVIDAILAGDLAGAVALIEGRLNEVTEEVASGSGGGRGRRKTTTDKASDSTNDKIKKDQKALKKLTKEIERNQRARERAEQQRIGRVDYQLEYELELARLNADKERIAILEREIAIRERIAQLKQLGAEGDLRGRATEEVDEIRGAEVAKGIRDGVERQREQFREVFSTAFEQAVATGNFGNAIKQVFADRVAEGMRKALDNLADVIFNLFKNIDFGGGGGFGGIFGGIASLFGGGKASGGPVKKGSFYRVGEYNRPEMFRAGNKAYLIPGENGMVSPLRGLDAPPSNAGFSIDNSVVIQGSITEEVWPKVRAHLQQRDAQTASQMVATARAVYAKDRSRGRI